jgi:hypothetical protein
LEGLTRRLHKGKVVLGTPAWLGKPVFLLGLNAEVVERLEVACGQYVGVHVYGGQHGNSFERAACFYGNDNGCRLA